MIHVLRNAWVYLVSVVLTIFYAGRITFLSYVWPARLEDFCDEAPRVWSKGILRVAGVDVEIEGTENIDPDRAQIVASNHASWFDVFALAAYFPGVYHFVAKQELARIPIFGRSWIACEHIAIDRSNHSAAVASLDRAAEKIRSEDATIVMFPEGTRSPTGELQRFKKGTFVLALEAGVPVVPVAILGSHEVMPKGSWTVRPGRIRVRIGAPIPVEGLDLTDRDALLTATRAAVADLLAGGPLDAELPEVRALDALRRREGARRPLTGGEEAHDRRGTKP